MTGRSPGAPDPAEPSHSGDAPAEPPTDPDLLRRTDAIIEALAARSAATEADEGDPAVQALRALLDDVDEPGGLRLIPGGVPGAPKSRRGRRTIVALGIVGAVLATTGVAAAGSGIIEQRRPAPAVAQGTPAGPGPSAPPAETVVERPRAKPRPAKRAARKTSRPNRRKASRKPPRDAITELRRRLENLLPTYRGPHGRGHRPRLP
ncbi:hypothetical protein [Actinomadura macrotermitis]|uniref:Uncharacterized protein n=1 Tax=Actinomadura macrotermitis TaxID=2585200 RepID=A0A7K0C2A7_9ACTN|nr:hypothetical protein [Actinomadura macrotermitis]MQY07550.1 hypothetical protein [Actinomadura macrotermitis]